MISQEKNTQLALTILNDQLFFVEVEQSPTIRLLTAGEVGLKMPFDAHSVNSPQLVSQYAEDINKLIDRFAISAPFAAFSLDKKLALLRRVKIDRELKDAEISQHINWEMEQFLLSQRNEYHVNYERVRYQRDHFDYLIVAAVRKPIITFIMDVFKRTPITLKILDINILSSIRGLFALEYADDGPGLSVIIAFEDHGIQVILVKESAYIKSADIEAGISGTTLAIGGQQTEELATLINDQIHTLLDSLGDEVLLKDVESIYLLNGRAHVNVVSSLQKLQRSSRIHFIEPLKNIKHSLSIEEEGIIAANPMSFLALLGALQREK